MGFPMHSDVRSLFESGTCILGDPSSLTSAIRTFTSRRSDLYRNWGAMVV